MAWSELLFVGVVHSLVFCVFFGVLLLLGCLLAPDAMAHDYPKAIQDRYGPKSERGRRVAALMSVLLALAAIASPTVAMVHLSSLTGRTPGFLDGFVYGVTLMLVLNVFDLLVLDWWLFCTVQPRWLVLPGTEGMPEYRDKAFHVKVLFPRPVPWPILLIPGYGAVVGAITAGVAAVG